MRLRDLTEAIPQPPRSIHYYVTAKRNLGVIVDAMKQASKQFVALSHDRYVEEKINRALEELKPDLRVDILDYIARRAVKEAPELMEMIDNFILYQKDRHGSNFLRFIYDRLEIIKEEFKDYPLVDVPSAAAIEAAMRSYSDGVLFDSSYFGDEENALIAGFLDGSKLMAPASRQLADLLVDLKAKLDAHYARQARFGRHHNDRDAPPEHHEIETLYHVSAWAEEVSKTGFIVEPTERKGVGNLGSQDGISFTHDLRVALQITRCLKEMAMIASGQLRATAIYDWMGREGIDRSPKQLWQHIGTAESPGKYTVEQTAKLYNLYLWMSKRYNPVFIGAADTVKALMGRPMRHIGVLACEVQLDPKQYQYLDAEAEFRVPASAVLSVKRIA